MKKVISVLLLLCALCSVSLAVFAGSIDTELVADNEALVFIGSIDQFAITYEGTDYPYTEYTVRVTPSQKIKGDVTVGKPMAFEKLGVYCMELQKDCNYLFGYMQDILYIWELDSYDNVLDWERADYTKDSIILKERHNDTIAGGIQNQLNEGVFFRAEEDRQHKKAEDAAEKKNSSTANNHILFACVGIILGIAVICFAVLCYRRRKNNNQNTTKPL